MRVGKYALSRTATRLEEEQGFARSSPNIPNKPRLGHYR